MTHLVQAAVLAGVIFSLTAPVAAGTEDDDLARRITAAQVPLETFPEPLRFKVRSLLQDPTVYCRGPVEAFPCRPGVYHWLVDHPHWGFRAWRSLGTKGATVERKDDGSFLGTDLAGSEIRWQLILAERGRRIWYAEGIARPAPLTPGVPLRALVLLRYQEATGQDGRVGIRHRAELFAQFENTRAASWAARLSGRAPEDVARKAVQQISLFFSGMAWYVTEHPAWARTVFQPTSRDPADERRQAEMILRELSGLAKPPSVPSSASHAALPEQT